ncbi:hypothetical protein DF186_21680, partial [Enterococcus hirae]
MPRRLAAEGAQAVLGRAPPGCDAPRADGRRAVRRGDDVRQVQEGMLHLEAAVAHGLDPPGVEAGGEGRVRLEVIVE